MAGDETHRMRRLPMGQRYAKLGRRRQCRGDTRHHAHADAGSLQRLDLLAGAAENHRVAGFQPHHAFALAGQLDHQRVDIVLLAGGPLAALAHHHPLRFAPRQLQHIVGNQIVEQDHIGGLQRAHCLEREQFGIARPGTNQGDLAHDAASRIGQGQQAFRLRFLGGAIEGVIGEAFPEAAPRRLIGQQHCQPAPDRLGRRCPSAERQRQGGFDTAADRLRQHRRRTIGGNADHHRRAVDDGAELHIAESRLVDDAA